MLSISTKIDADYYEALAREDYYELGGEPQGKWYGNGAEELGLEGAVKPGQLSQMVAGFHPETGEKLARNAGHENRNGGLDLTFSAPKSVSAVWSVSDQADRKGIQEAQEQAVKTALTYLENEAGYSRTGEGGTGYEKAKLTFAMYEHGTSRAQDPQLHTHAVLINAGVGEDGKKRAIDASFILEHKMAAGAVYRSALADELRQRGYEINRDGWKFEIGGVPKDLTDHWSTRRKEVEQHLEKEGYKGARAAAVSVLETRDPKKEKPREQLLNDWRETGEQFGFGRDQAAALRQEKQQLTPEQKQEVLQAAAERVRLDLEREKSYFREKDVIERVANETAGKGVSAEEVIRYSREHLKHGREIVHLGQEEKTVNVKAFNIETTHSNPTKTKSTGVHHDIYTTKTTLEREGEIIRSLEKGREQSFLPVRENAVALSGVHGLSDEQTKAVRKITEDKGRIQLVVGKAGAGKTTMLSAAREVWEADGYKVRGAALAGIAAGGLQRQAGIESDTVAGTLKKLGSGELQFDKKTVLVVDEAAMVSTKDLHQLVRATEASGSKLVLVGDYRQLQSIEAGGAFLSLTRREQAAELSQNYRQQGWQAVATEMFAAGRGREGLEQYAARGFVHVGDNRNQAKEKLIQDWANHDPKDSFIVTGTRAEAAELNSRAQTERLARGQLGKDAVKIGDDKFYKGDRIRFTRGSKLLGVKNHTRGTVAEIGPKGVKVKLDSGKDVSFRPAEWKHAALGYAGTTHALQGGTAERSFVLAGGHMQDAELTYVQASRHRQQLNFYVDKLYAGEKLQDLTRQMERSHKKETAHDKAQTLSHTLER